MKYSIVDKINNKKQAKKDAMINLAKIYAKAESLEEFKINADVGVFSRFMIMRFVIYYKFKVFHQLFFNPEKLIFGIAAFSIFGPIIGINIWFNFISPPPLVMLIGTIGGLASGWLFAYIFDTWYSYMNNLIWPFER